MNAKPAWPNKESDVHAIYSRVFLLVGAGWGEGAAAWSHVGPEAVRSKNTEPSKGSSDGPRALESRIRCAPRYSAVPPP